MTYFKWFLFLLLLSLSLPGIADNDWSEDEDEDKYQYSPHEIKALKTAGKITSLEHILDQLRQYDVSRLLEVELIENKDHPDNSEYLYQIEYINHQGIVLELEVDALTSQVLHLDNDLQTSQHKDDN